MNRESAGADEPLGISRDWSDPDLVAVYDELPLWSAMAGLLLLEHVPMRRGMAVLDVGSGTGFPLVELAQRLGPASRVVGLDPWSEALARAQAKTRVRGLANCAIVRGRAESLPLCGERFDLVVSNLGINNFDDPLRTLAECRRVLARDGVLALTTNLQGHMRELYEVFEATLRESGDEDDLERLRAHIAHRATIPGLRALFEKAGLRVTRVVEQSHVMRFADGGALLRHWFIRLGFLEGWSGVVDPGRRRTVFDRLEHDLDRVAVQRGELALTIPFAYVEGIRAS